MVQSRGFCASVLLCSRVAAQGGQLEILEILRPVDCARGSGNVDDVGI